MPPGGVNGERMFSELFPIEYSGADGLRTWPRSVNAFGIEASRGIMLRT
jgi:hypothetical protein